MKIVTISVVRGVPAGIAKQLQFEHDVAGELSGVCWETLMYTTDESSLPFARRIPFLFRPLFLRNLYGWIVALRKSKTADYILMRYMLFDLFGVFLSPLIKNRISVHHAIEPEELKVVRAGWKGLLASNLERLTGYFIISKSAGILGVTREIAEYENSRISRKKTAAIFPNGINPHHVHASEDCRVKGEINAVFICQEFSRWQGLEKLIHDSKKFRQTVGRRIKIHLIGDISFVQRKMIEELLDPSVFVIHGKLNEDAYRKLFSIADVGIGSLALEEEGLLEGSTLKVREMLGSGLPVYSSHIDSALPVNFPFYKYESVPTIKGLYSFASCMTDVDRKSVRQVSLPYISKSNAMLSVADYLRKLSNNDRQLS